MATLTASRSATEEQKIYQRRIQAWTMYDWANSAFVTTVIAAVMPIYFNQVAGANLPSDAAASGYWNTTTSIALIIAAIISPILGTISDVMRGKKRFLAIFAGIGIVATALLVFVGTGDWMLAALLVLIGRIGFAGSISFYDSLLPHVAKEEDRDSVSARGYAFGYLGGGILLAINAGMIFAWGIEDGAKASFVSVALWWLFFSLPIFREVPEPPAATEVIPQGETVVSVSFKRIGETLRELGKYRELVKYTIAFLIYNDGIGTIINTATIYGAELGFGSISLILALLMVQFVGIPFSLVFGQLPNPNNKRRAAFLAFVVFNLIAMPLVGIIGSRALPENITGRTLDPTVTVDGIYGTGIYSLTPDLDDAMPINPPDGWTTETLSAATLGTEQAQIYTSTDAPEGRADFSYSGENLTITYASGPDYGIWAVLVDGEPLYEEDGEDENGNPVFVPVVIDAYHETPRYGESITITPSRVENGELVPLGNGVYTVSLVNTGERNENSSGSRFAFSQINVEKVITESSLPIILGTIAVVQAVALLFAFTIGQNLFRSIVQRIDTRRGILLALGIYSLIATWGFFLGSSFEFWFLAWMVGVVQGGSQALSRSLFAALSPAAKSGEFFGLFGVLEKFTSIFGPIIFALAAFYLNSSRPAILSLILFFIVGGYLLTRVNIEEGKRVAQEEDRAVFGTAAAGD
jgi:MFS transporter, UMF1 family